MQDRYIKTHNHVRQTLVESVNILRKKKNLTRDEIERHRAIGYLCNLIMQAIDKSDLEKRIEELEAKLK